MREWKEVSWRKECEVNSFLTIVLIRMKGQLMISITTIRISHHSFTHISLPLSHFSPFTHTSLPLTSLPSITSLSNSQHFAHSSACHLVSHLTLPHLFSYFITFLKYVFSMPSSLQHRDIVSPGNETWRKRRKKIWP